MSMYQVRLFEREKDYAMIEDWHHRHGQTAPPAAILPRLGVVVTSVGEGVAALWLYMDNSVGVCFPEHAVTRPGLRTREAKAALLGGLDFLRSEASSLGYGFMMINTPRAFARVLKREGLFAEAGRDKVTMIGATKENYDGN